MPFISEHILIDLPFYKPVESSGQGNNQTLRWPDNRWGDRFVEANDKCSSSRLASIGSCVEIKEGGKLTFTLPPEIASDPRFQEAKQLTVEFWAEPAVLSNTRKQLLNQPVNVWMEGKSVFFLWGGTQSPKTYKIEGVEGLHHWAIAIDASTNSPTIRIFRDGSNQTFVEAASSTASAGNSEPLTIGADVNGWTGKLAHLRIWSVALTPEQIQQNRDRDTTAHAAFKASTGIEWRLLNAYDEPSIYIQSSRGQPDLRLEIENATKETTLEIPQTVPSKDDPNNYHFQLEFRAGTIASHLLGEESALLKAIRGRNEGWNVSLTHQAGQDGIAFLRTGSEISLEPGAKLTLWIPGIVAELGSGSRSSHVMLRYQKIGINPSKGSSLPSPLDGHRLQRLNILYHEPSFDSYRRPPLEVGVVGAPVVLNNGTDTCLTLYIKNLHRNEDGSAAPLILGSANAESDTQPKFILDIDTLTKKDEIDAVGLGDADDLMGIVFNKSERFEKTGPQFSGSAVSWTITPKQIRVANVENKVGLADNETLLLSLSGFKTTAPPGRSILRLRYKDFDKYGEGVFEIPIDRTPAIPARMTQGGAGYGLAIGHDPRIGKPNPNDESLNEVLSLKKQQGNGGAVRIENAGGGAGLTVIQNGTGLAAQFRGGSNDADLSLHLRLDDVGIKDLSPHQRSCEVEGTLQIVNDPDLGRCLSFNGNEWITCSNIALTNSSFTIQFWAKRREVTGSIYGFIISQEQQPPPSNRKGKSLHIGFRLPENGETFTFAFWVDDLNVPHQGDPNWHHWACVYNLDRKQQVVYRDGVVVGTTTNIDPYSGTGNFVIGKAINQESSSPFKGELADVRVHTRALSSQEISRCMNAIVVSPAVHIENVDVGHGLLVAQYGNGLAAKFSGGSGVEITKNLQVGQRIRDKTGEIMPVGAVLPFAGAVAPEGWLICNGQMVTDEKFADLAKVLGKQLPFEIPNYQERFLVGASTKSEYVLGKTGGLDLVQLTEPQLPSHNHSGADTRVLIEQADTSHTHSVMVVRQIVEVYSPEGKNKNYWKVLSNETNIAHRTGYPDSDSEIDNQNRRDHAHRANIVIANSGQNQSHENRPPFVALNYIIKY